MKHHSSVAAAKQIAAHLEKINKILNSSIQQDPRYNSTDPSILNAYRVEINKALSHALRTHTISEQSVKAAKRQRNRLFALNDSIQGRYRLCKSYRRGDSPMRKELKDGYNIIASNRTFVQFDNAGDEELYTKENAETRTKRMASVIDVFFVDFLKRTVSRFFLVLCGAVHIG